jgi:hypothetical protein
MTNSVQQTTEGKVVISSGSQTYIDTAAHFALDFNTTAPTLPAGATERIYEQGVRHPFTNGQTIVGGGPIPWPTGDAYIVNIGTGLSNQAIRKAAEPPPTPPPSVPP